MKCIYAILFLLLLIFGLNAQGPLTPEGGTNNRILDIDFCYALAKTNYRKRNYF